MTRGWRFLRSAVVVVVVGAALSACGSSSGPSSVALGHGVTVVVPSGANFTPTETQAPGSESSLLAKVALGRSIKGPSPFTSLITPVHLRWTGTFPKQGVELDFRVKVSRVPASATPIVATYDPTTKTWHPVASTFDAKTGVVSAHADHFSIWGVFDFSKPALTALAKDVYSSLFGAIKVTEPAPVCTNSAGVTAVASPADGVLNVCAQNNGGTSVTLKVRSDLAFPVDVIPPAGTQIAVNPPGGIFEQIGGYLNKAGTGQSTRTLVVAGSEAGLTFPIAADHYRLVLSDFDVEAYLTSIIDSAVSLLTVIYGRLGGSPKVALNAIGKGACLAEATQALDTKSPVSLSTASALTRVAFDCASAVLDLGAVGVIQGVIMTIASLIENVLQTGFFGAVLVAGGLSGLTSTITVSRAATANASSNLGQLVGLYYVHAGHLVIRANGTATLNAPDYLLTDTSIAGSVFYLELRLVGTGNGTATGVVLSSSTPKIRPGTTFKIRIGGYGVLFTGLPLVEEFCSLPRNYGYCGA